LNEKYQINGDKLISGNHEIPIIWEGDVVVIGGGVAGVTAAAASSRRRVKTIVIEKSAFMGGMVSYAAGLSIGGAFPGYVSIGGMMDELLAKLRFAGLDSAEMVDVEGFGVNYFPESEYFKFLTEDILIKSGCEILMHSLVVDVIMEKQIIKGVIVENAAGKGALLAEAVVDCTGDAQIALKAGASFEAAKTNEIPLIYTYIIGNVDIKRVEAHLQRDCYFKDAILKAKSEYLELSNEDKLWDLVNGLREGTFFANTIRVKKCGCNDVKSITRAEMEAHKKLFIHIEFFRKYVEGMENCYLLRCSNHVSELDPRRIIGEETLTFEDCKNLRKFDNGILRSSGPSCELTLGSSNLDRIRVLTEQNDWFEVPYGALVPKNVDNLIVAGKSISVDAGAQSTLGMAQMMVLGQAAGIAGSIVSNGTKAREVDGRMIRSLLDELGCDIDGDKTRQYKGDKHMTLKGHNSIN